MTRFRNQICAVSMVAANLLLVLPAQTSAATNLISNPSLEIQNAANTAVPEAWNTGSWGGTVATFTYLATGHTGTHSVRTQVTSPGTGDAKWYFQKVPVTPGTTYTFSDYYISDVPSLVTIEFTATNGVLSYIELGRPGATATWQQFQKNFTVPAGVSSLTAHHVISSVGSLVVDDYSLTGPDTPPPPPPPPTNNLIPNPTFAQNAGGVATAWLTGKWGSAASATFAYPVSGVDDGFAASVTVPSYTGGVGSGAAQWYFVPVPVTGGASYTFSDAYRSTTGSYVFAQWTLQDNSVRYTPVATLPATNNIWQSTSQFLTAPANAKSLSIFHQLQSVGTLVVDNFSLAPAAPSSASYAKGIVSLTFDDGLMSQFDNAVPILRLAQIPATFFIITDRMMEFAYDMFTDSRLQIRTQTTANMTTWSEIYTDPTETKYRFSDTYTSPSPSTISASYNLNGVPTSVTVGTVSAGTNARASFVITLPVSNGRTVTPITIQHSGTNLSISRPSLIPNSFQYIGPTLVQDLRDYGMEIAAHTKTHAMLSAVPISVAQLEIAGSRQALQAIGISPADTLAYPHGMYNADIQSLARSAGFIAARTVDVGYNTPQTDKWALKSQSMATASTLTDVQSWIDVAIANKLWLVITLHNVNSLAKLTQTGDPYGTTPELLQQIVNYIKTKQAAGVIDVKTLHDGALAL